MNTEQVNSNSEMERKSILPDDVWRHIKDRCKDAGVPIAKMTKEAGINRSSIDRWQNEEPKTFKVLRQIESALDRIEHRNKLRSQR